MKASVEYITPEKAAEMLLENPNNRKLEPGRVTRFADQMMRGAWLQNGASIVMNGSTLLDGQHRLSALIEANVTLPMVVVREVPSASFSTIDTGKSRSFSDYLTIAKRPHAATLAAAVRQYLVLSAGLTPASAYSGTPAALTFDELYDAMQSTPQIAKSVEFVMSIPAKLPLRPAMLAALHARFTEFESGLADRYIMSIGAGTNLPDGSVEAAVYRRIINRDRGQVRVLKSNEKVYVVIRGWNALRAGETFGEFIRIQQKGKKLKMPTIQ